MVLRVSTEWSGTMQGLPYFSNLYFGGTTDGEADAAVAAVTAFWQAVDDRVANNLTWTISSDVESIDLLTGNVIAVFSTPGGTGSGAETGDLAPPYTQGLIRWRTGVYSGGREVRGRTFIPGVTENQNTEGVPVATYISGNATAAQTLITASAPAGNLRVYSPTKQLASTVTSASTWNQWAVLRSRRD